VTSDVVQVFFQPNPVSPGIEDVWICPGQTATVQVEGNFTSHWAEEPDFESIIASGNLETPPLSSPAIYYMLPELDGCFGEIDSVQIEITALPDAATLSTTAPVCLGE